MGHPPAFHKNYRQIHRYLLSPLPSRRRDNTPSPINEERVRYFSITESEAALQLPFKQTHSTPMKVITILSQSSMLQFTTSFPLITTTRHAQRVSFHSTSNRRYGYPHKSMALYLNRILFDSSEIDTNDDVVRNDDGHLYDTSKWMATVTLPKSDYRTIHIAKILRLQNGDCVRAGSVIHSDDNDAVDNTNGAIQFESNLIRSNNNLQGLLTDQATIQWLPEGKIKKAEPTKNGEPPGSLRLYIPKPPKTILHKPHDDESVPPVALLLALPRPLQLQRMLPMISQLGIHTLLLTHAAKVPKDYFGSHLFRKPTIIRDLLIEGLTLSGMDLRLPHVCVRKRPLCELFEEIEERFPREEWVRVIAHPERKGLDDIRENGESIEVGEKVIRITDLDFPMVKNGNRKRILVAVG